VVLTAVHSSKPVARRDIGEVARRQITVCFESVLYPKASQISSVYSGTGRASEFAFDSPGFNLDATSHPLEEWESDVLGRRSVGRSKRSAFVDGVAEDQRLADHQQYSSYGKARLCFNRTYHFRNLPILKTSSIVRKQRNAISNRAEPRHIRSVPDDMMQAIVIDSLHASKLFFSVETIAAELLSQDRKSSGVSRVDLASSAGLCDDTSNDGIFGVGVAVRVRGVASCGLAPENHVVWIAASRHVNFDIVVSGGI
jgi:hypothetical protein